MNANKLKAILREYIDKKPNEPPLIKGLKLVAKEMDSSDDLAEIVCMIEQVEEFMLVKCSYCKHGGHTRRNCATFVRIKHALSCDPRLNKVRGRRSVKLQRESRGAVKIS